MRWSSRECGLIWMPESSDNARRRFVSAQDVAERAGVSRSAVSRAFTPGASIAPATLRARAGGGRRPRIPGQSISRAGCCPSEPARRAGDLRHRDTVPGADRSRALSRALIERGNVPAIIKIGPTAEDVANASRQLLRYRAEATVFLSGSPPASLVELTRRNGQPLILINRAETERRQRPLRRPGRHAAGLRGALTRPARRASP